MNKITIQNEFTGRAITVDASKPLTAKKIASWRNKLQAKGCTSGDTLGGRGRQENAEAYEALLSRAEQVAATRCDE